MPRCYLQVADTIYYHSPPPPSRVHVCTRRGTLCSKLRAPVRRKPLHQLKGRQVSIDNQAAITTISRPCYSHLAPLLHDIHKATSTLLLLDTAVQVGWTPSHSGIARNELAGAAAKLADEGTPSNDFPWPYAHLRSQIRSQICQEWHV